MQSCGRCFLKRERHLSTARSAPSSTVSQHASRHDDHRHHLFAHFHTRTLSACYVSYFVLLLLTASHTMASDAVHEASSSTIAFPSGSDPDSRQPVGDGSRVLLDMFGISSDFMDSRDIVDNPQSSSPANRDALLVLLPLLIILSSLLFLLLLFLVCVLLLRRRRGISLGDNDGPIDMSREELIDGEGGFEGVEERWLETVDEETQRQYRRAKGMPNR